MGTRWGDGDVLRSCGVHGGPGGEFMGVQLGTKQRWDGFFGIDDPLGDGDTDSCNAGRGADRLYAVRVESLGFCGVVDAGLFRVIGVGDEGVIEVGLWVKCRPRETGCGPKGLRSV